MIFVGGGALLERAVKFCISQDLEVELVISNTFFRSSKINTSQKFEFIQSNDLNISLLKNLENRTQTKVFSINNNQIIKDSTLSLNHTFFNIHNGLVHDYRGFGEVCVFAAICKNERIYGATIQKLLPKYKVDSGPIVSTRSFKIKDKSNFFELFQNSLQNCEKLFEENVLKILNNSYDVHETLVLGQLYLYKDVRKIISQTDDSLVRRAMDMRHFEVFLPKLKSSFSEFSD
jgi:methionyl-tRNA formyltransferase